ncbi:MAG: FCD domain-containing protein [Candidatus Thalassarchaeaceae archaeon]|nr:FCD domain-containing protein [Candidatus Thalassarchaeaceae archaeon]
MAVGSGMRLNGAMSILLVVLLILGGMASMSSLEMNDASASDGNDANDKLQDNSKENSNDLLEKCESFREKNLDDDLGEWTHLREQHKFDWDKTRPVDFSTEGRQSSDSANNTTNNEVDWHLPDHITVVRTDFGYTISIIDDNGVTTTENYTEEDFTQFLVRFGWEPNTNDGELEDDERDRGEIREMVANLREACSNGDEDACRELRAVMERLREARDRADREEVPEISLEFLDDGTIVAHREFSDGNFEYDIISTGDNGDLSIVRVSAWGTDVIHPKPPKEDRRGEKGEKGNFESPHDFSEKMSDEDFRAKCQELLGENERTPIDVDSDRLDRVPMERESERR